MTAYKQSSEGKEGELGRKEGEKGEQKFVINDLG